MDMRVAIELVRMHQQFDKMVKMKAQVQGGAGGGASRSSMAKMQQQFKGNPKAMMQAHLKNTIGADAIASMGGMDKVMEMMAEQGQMMNPDMAGGMPGAMGRRARGGRR